MTTAQGDIDAPLPLDGRRGEGQRPLAGRRLQPGQLESGGCDDSTPTRPGTTSSASPRTRAPSRSRPPGAHATDKFEPGSGSGQFRMFNEAADVLLDPERRAAYDATLDAERDGSPTRRPVDDRRPDVAAVVRPRTTGRRDRRRHGDARRTPTQTARPRDAEDRSGARRRAAGRRTPAPPRRMMLVAAVLALLSVAALVARRLLRPCRCARTPGSPTPATRPRSRPSRPRRRCSPTTTAAARRPEARRGPTSPTSSARSTCRLRAAGEAEGRHRRARRAEQDRGHRHRARLRASWTPRTTAARVLVYVNQVSEKPDGGPPDLPEPGGADDGPRGQPLAGRRRKSY